MLKRDPRTLEDVFNVLKNRKKANPKESYTASLYQSGRDFINKKIIEEAFEFSQTKNKKTMINEFCDLLYHSYVLLNYKNIPYQDIEKEMLRRTGISGITEKKNRFLKK